MLKVKKLFGLVVSIAVIIVIVLVYKTSPVSTVSDIRFDKTKSFVKKISYQSFEDGQPETRFCDCLFEFSSSTEFVTKSGVYKYVSYFVKDKNSDEEEISEKGVLYFNDKVLAQSFSDSPKSIDKNTFSNIKFSSSGRYVYFDNNGYEDGSANIFDTKDGIKNITNDFSFTSYGNYAGPYFLEISQDESSFVYILNCVNNDDVSNFEEGKCLDVYVKDIKGVRILKTIKLNNAGESLDISNTKLTYKTKDTVELELWTYKNDPKKSLLKEKLEIKIN